MRRSGLPAYNLHDVEGLARRRLPLGIFEYIAGGAEDGLAVVRNRDAFARVGLVPRILRDVTGRSAGSSLMGQPAAMPVAIAPTGSAGLVWFQGELALAKAAAGAGVPFTLATNAMTSMETIAREAGGRLWFQLNMFAHRPHAYDLLERAQRLGFEALVLTVDASVVPNREYNARNGFTVPFRFSWRSAFDMLQHPRWLLGVMGRYALASGMPRFENFPPELRDKVTGFSTARSASRCEDLSWADLQTLRQRWPGKLLVKGVLRPDDAARAVALGVDGVIVSNHGGRTVDSAPAPLEMLPAVAHAVAGRAQVLLDGGIRRGSDVIKALALGAHGVLLGRPTLYGTALAGEAGASQVLHLLQTEIERELGLLGYQSLDQLADPGLLHLTRRGETWADTTTAA